jgi:hypothetical protein
MVTGLKQLVCRASVMAMRIAWAVFLLCKLLIVLRTIAIGAMGALG